MKPFFALALLALPLAAGEGLRIAAVERKGSPPFEDDRRVYRIEGADVARVRVGEKLILSRAASAADPGRLKVAVVAPGFAEAYLDRRGSTYPLLGDQAEPGRARALPEIPRLRHEPDLRLVQPSLTPPLDPPPTLLPSTAGSPVTPSGHGRPAAGAGEPEPYLPRFQEPVFFLEGDGALSPKGREKLKRIVADWGAEGVWSLGLPEDRTLPSKVRETRIRTLRAALRGLGVDRLEVRSIDLRPGDRGDVVYAAKK